MDGVLTLESSACFEIPLECFTQQLACRMWSVWMFTIPSLRARECTDSEKDWLNYAFLAVPLLNVTLPFVWKSFAFVYSADCVALAAIYYWKITLPAQADAEA